MARENGAAAILLAHHRRDQAETVLLQALRGAGAAGLAAMPRCHRARWSVVAPSVARPAARGDRIVRAPAQASFRGRHVERRSALCAQCVARGGVAGADRARFPMPRARWSPLARRAHEAQQVLAEVAEPTSRRSPTAPCSTSPRWRALPPARRANALRAWLQRALERGAPESLVARLLARVARKRRRRAGRSTRASSSRCYRGRLRAHPGDRVQGRAERRRDRPVAPGSACAAAVGRGARGGRTCPRRARRAC